MLAKGGRCQPALGAAGAGSMVAALVLPRVLDRVTDRTTMLFGGGLLTAGLLAASVVNSFAMLVVCWLVLGVGLGLIQTPAGRLIQRSASSVDRPALFAAQFSLSHFCWLLTYPVAGVLGEQLGLDHTALLLAFVALAASCVAAYLWPGPRRGDRRGASPETSPDPGR